MLQIGNKPVDTMYVGGKLVQQVYKGSKKVYPEHGVIPKAIKDSMVLWYDLKRQGATNENMAADPTLRDLSGNGHDATCYNFAWSGMSGIGGYQPTGCAFNNPNNTTGKATINGNKVHITHTPNTRCAAYNNGSTQPGEIRPKTYFKITGITGTGLSLNTTYQISVKPITEDGIYYFEEYTNFSQSITYNDLFFEENSYDKECNITIEQLPQYPHALVSDGVDDYAQVTGLPLFTPETGYTVIAKRKLVENNVSNIFLSKRAEGTNADCAFTFESTLSSQKRCDSFSARNSVSFVDAEDISYQTSIHYNEGSINKGQCEDTDKFYISYPNYYCKFVLYSVLLFNRDLTDNEIEWVKKNMVEQNENTENWYGVEFYTTSPYPDCIRIGNMDLHRSLPVHSQMKGVLLADDGTENKMLNESDWTGETLDGSQGQVMVEMPKESYWKFETDGNIRRVKFSTKPLPGFKPTPQGYVSAYEASLQRSTNKLASVVNTDADYRGGNNSALWDGTYRSLLGMPATKINRTNFRTYARNRKADSTEWNMMTYDMQKLLYWLFVVEYATLNTQKEFNSDKDSNGYAQGGLGNGVTNLDTGRLVSFNGYNPIIPCGYTNSLGNGTGQIAYTMPFEYDANGKANYVGEYSAESAYTDGQFVSQGEDLYECIANAAAGTALTNTTYFKKVTRTVTYAPRYRGIENPFGNLWQWTDGINVRISPTADNGGDNLSKVYVCSDPDQFKDNGYDGYTYVGDEARTAQYVKEVIFGEGGEIMPKVVGDGASSTKYFCDQHYTTILDTENLRGVLFGGAASHGAHAGFAVAYSAAVPSDSPAAFGSRLCFIPE